MSREALNVLKEAVRQLDKAEEISVDTAAYTHTDQPTICKKMLLIAIFESCEGMVEIEDGLLNLIKR